jgi:hypothetical protein
MLNSMVLATKAMAANTLTFVDWAIQLGAVFVVYRIPVAL